jgi:hypothetical protein
MTIEEAAERLLGAILVEFAVHDDDTLLPVRLLFEEIAEACNVTNADLSAIPEWETMGWVRERMREARAALAKGEQIP